MSMLHQPVMAQQALVALNIKKDGRYLDMTFGRGGHSNLILQALGKEGRLTAIDRDSEAVTYGQCIQDERFDISHGDFASLDLTMTGDKGGAFDGVLLDLGLSSPQLDDAERGFSYRQAGKLDMRMDTSQGISAAQWLEQVQEQELRRCIFLYGEEKQAGKIAKHIVKHRESKSIATTEQLVAVLKEAMPFWYPKKHPARRTFQAIRMAVNQEWDQLEKGLEQAFARLVPGGRLVVISFHSIEHRIVKQFIQKYSAGNESYDRYSMHHQQEKCVQLKRIGRRVLPSVQEAEDNPRARSAQMRVAERLV